MTELRKALVAIPQANMGSAVDSAEYAMQMLRFPLRQVFGDKAVTTVPDAFAPTIKMTVLTGRFALAQQVLGH